MMFAQNNNPLGMLGSNNKEDQLHDGNTYNSPENNLQQQNAGIWRG
jgi:hypothetical protein